ncbi:hypothetical protein RN001_000377 [Aquatica leii]|uniref:Carotenoid isomerooxygenase n=1 Tax=Aquatica leii TaxID=1421715 RepID=A0AAN7PM70_9COLE|nr:hypothetical protein RN001_000377 [Aquatica leii]
MESFFQNSKRTTKSTNHSSIPTSRIPDIVIRECSESSFETESENQGKNSQSVLVKSNKEKQAKVSLKVWTGPVKSEGRGRWLNMNENKIFPNCEPNIWLRSCTEEIIKPIHGKVSGTIPKWLSGVLYRNGPGLLEIGDYKFGHLFDGMALLHRFSIKNGKVTYQCRFLQSDTYKKNKRANRIVVTDFGTCSVPDPCQSIFKRVASYFDWHNSASDNAMISVYPFGDELYSFAETPIIHKINKNTLATEGKIDFGKTIGIVSHSSHPHIAKDGTVYNLGMSVSATGLRHNIVCFPKKPKKNKSDYSMFDKAHVVADIPSRWLLEPCYMHTFGITKNYFLIVEQPLCLVTPKLFWCKLTNKRLHSAMKWYENEMTQINVVSRSTGKLIYKFYAEAFFYLHIINQYEESNHVILDICSYKDASMIDCMYIEAIQNAQSNPYYADMFRSRSIRFALPLVDTKHLDVGKNLVRLKKTRAQAYLQKNGNVFVQPEKLCDLGCETPRINYEYYSGRKYRYYYAISADVDGDNPGTLIKVDTYKKTTSTWCEDNCYCSEPVFVPLPNAQKEDDGVLVLALLWGGTDTNHVGLLVVDAKTMLEIGRVEFVTPTPIPKCLHGWFSPNN